MLVVGIAGCSSDTSRRAGTSGARLTPEPHTRAAALIGKFTAAPIVFADARLGLVTIAGFVGDSTTVSSWQERTTDSGRTWTAGPVAHTSDGRYPTQVATTQIGLAFGRGSAGWAYQPSLFFTQDGGLTWQPEPGRPAGVGPVSVQGGSTWVVGYPCRSFRCPPTLRGSDRVGGPLTPLPAQPVSSGDVATLLRPSSSSAWVMAEDVKGRRRLITTADAGRTWDMRHPPCDGGTMDAYGDDPTAMYVVCAAPSTSMCDNCGARVLLRSADNGARWTRVETPSAPPGTPAQFQIFQPVGSSTIWAMDASQAGAGIVERSTDGGRTWRRVLGTAADQYAIDSFFAADAAHAWFVRPIAHGVGFEVYRTSDGGHSWQHSALPIPTTLR